MKKLLLFLVCILMAINSTHTLAATPLGTLDCRVNSNPDYMFTLRDSGQRFLLLDITDDKNSKFFLMGVDYYGEGAFDEFGNQRLDTQLMSNVAYKLNKILVGEGFIQSHTQKTYKLPDNVVKYIDFNHLWKTEGTGNQKGKAKDDYTTICGVNLLSQDEFVRYKSKIGACDEMFSRKYSPRASGWWFRDGMSDGTAMLAMRTGDAPWIGGWAAADASLFYRPIFYVNRDFFANVPIDLKTVGSNVKEVFKTYCTVGELKKMYKEGEIYDYLDYTPSVEIKVTEFTDGKKSVSCIRGAKGISAKVNINNNTSDSHKGIVTLTYYDRFARPIDIDCKKIEIMPEENVLCDLELLFRELPVEGSYVKITFIENKKITQANNSVKFYYD